MVRSPCSLEPAGCGGGGEGERERGREIKREKEGERERHWEWERKRGRKGGREGEPGGHAHTRTSNLRGVLEIRN